MKNTEFYLEKSLTELTAKEMQNINGGWKLLDKIGEAIGKTLGAIAYGIQKAAEEIDKALLTKAVLE